MSAGGWNLRALSSDSPSRAGAKVVEQLAAYR